MLDVLDLIKTEVEACEVSKLIQAANMRDEVVVEIEVLQRASYTIKTLNVLDEILPEADSRDLLEAFEPEGGD